MTTSRSRPAYFCDSQSQTQLFKFRNQTRSLRDVVAAILHFTYWEFTLLDPEKHVANLVSKTWLVCTRFPSAATQHLSWNSACVPWVCPRPQKACVLSCVRITRNIFFLVKLCKRVCNVIKSASSPRHQLICSGHDCPFLQATELKLRSAGCCHGSFLISWSLQTHRHLIAAMFTHASIKIPRWETAPACDVWLRNLSNTKSLRAVHNKTPHREVKCAGYKRSSVNKNKKGLLRILLHTGRLLLLKLPHFQQLSIFPCRCSWL